VAFWEIAWSAGDGIALAEAHPGLLTNLAKKMQRHED